MPVALSLLARQGSVLIVIGEDQRCGILDRGWVRRCCVASAAGGAVAAGAQKSRNRSHATIFGRNCNAQSLQLLQDLWVHPGSGGFFRALKLQLIVL